jgi:hypothetical protein
MLSNRLCPFGAPPRLVDDERFFVHRSSNDETMGAEKRENSEGREGG